MIKAILFDCFGVVIHDISFRQMLDEIESRDSALRRQVEDVVDENCAGLITGEESRNRIAKLLGMDPQEWQRQLSVGEIKNPSMLRLIRELRKDYKTGIVSNVGRGGLHSRFTQAELDSLFDAVVASGDIGAAKPEPAIFEHALTQLGVSPQESVFVDDYEPYVVAARSLGMQGILYKSFEQFSEQLDTLLSANTKN